MVYLKTIARYVHFFYYTASNWNILLAFFMLYHDIRGGLKYGIRSSFAPVPLSKLTITSSDITKSSPYEAVSFYILEKLLTAFRRLSGNTSLVDLGCGKGRVLTVAAFFGFNTVTGIDFAKELCDEAELNMQKVQQRFPSLQYKIVHANVLDYQVGPGDSVFFLFNPFAAETLDTFLDTLQRSLRAFPRSAWIIYASPLHAAVLSRYDYKTVYEVQMMNLAGKVFLKSADTPVREA